MSETKGQEPAKPRVGPRTFVGVGIGSAAIVAALLYAGKLKSQRGKAKPAKSED